MSEISQEQLPFLSLFVTGTVSQSFFSHSLSQWWAKKEICLVTSVVPFPCSQECQSPAGLCTKAPGVVVGCHTCPHPTAALANGSISCGSKSCRYFTVLVQSEIPQRTQSAEFWFLSWISLHTAISPSYLHQTSWKCCIIQLEIINFQNWARIRGIWGLGKREQHRAPSAGPAVKHSHRIQGMK